MAMRVQNRQRGLIEMITDFFRDLRVRANEIAVTEKSRSARIALETRRRGILTPSAQEDLDRKAVPNRQVKDNYVGLQEGIKDAMIENVAQERRNKMAFARYRMLQENKSIRPGIDVATNFKI